MIDSLLSNPTITMLEQTVSFTEQRHNLLVGDIANGSTPGYVQQDLSVQDFQKSLRRAIDQSRQSLNDQYAPESDESTQFFSDGSVSGIPVNKINSIPFHDRGVRSMEYLMGQLADNAMAHNMATQFLRSRYDQISRAISMKV
jgi:flagellar basal-body rod protein FlgB